jgi:hypothetical protein
VSELCSRCRRVLRKFPNAAERRTRRHDAGNEVMRALSVGPRTLGQMAEGVYGADTPANRRKVSAQLGIHRDFVEPLRDGKTWRLAQQHAEAAE